MLCIAAFVIFEVVKLLGFLEPVLLPILIAAVVPICLNPLSPGWCTSDSSRPWAVVTVMFAALPSWWARRHYPPSPDPADG